LSDRLGGLGKRLCGLGEGFRGLLLVALALLHRGAGLLGELALGHLSLGLRLGLLFLGAGELLGRLGGFPFTAVEGLGRLAGPRGRLLLLQALVEQPLARCKSNYCNAKIVLLLLLLQA